MKNGTEAFCICRKGFIGKHCQFCKIINAVSGLKNAFLYLNFSLFLCLFYFTNLSAKSIFVRNRQFSYKKKNVVFLAVLPQNCDDVWQAGYTLPGTYIIDMDGSGPLEETYAYCDNGVTSVTHNMPPMTVIKSEKRGDIKARINYK